MTFAADGQALGAAADAALAVEQQRTADAKALLAAALANGLAKDAQITDLNKQVADLIAAELAEDGGPPPPPPPPPPPSKMLMGSSPGAWGSSVVTVLGLKAGNVLRAFNPSDAKLAPVGCSVVYSNDGDPGKPPTARRGYDLAGAAVGSPAYTNWMGQLKAAFRDDAPHFWCCGHEEDISSKWSNDAVLMGHVYDGMKVVLADFNKGRKFPVQTVVITTGMPFDDASANGYQKWNLASADVVGFDNYARGHWATMAGWAKKIGKPWGVGENGIQAQTDPNKYTDDQLLVALQADYTAALAGGCAWFCYWPNGGNDLRNKPKTAAYLMSLVGA